MKPDLTTSSLSRFLDTQSIGLSPTQSEQLMKYYSLLNTWKSKANLISRGDYAYIRERHFLTSFCYGYFLKDLLKPGDHIVDMGSGAGFPGVILSILFPQNKITLIDSSRKKALFLRQVQRDLNINAQVINDRLEVVSDLLSRKAGLVVARALSTIPELVKYGKPFLSPGGCLLTLKGTNYRKELRGFNYEKVSLTEIPIEKAWTEQSSYLQDKIFIKWTQKTT